MEKSGKNAPVIPIINRDDVMESCDLVIESKRLTTPLSIHQKRELVWCMRSNRFGTENAPNLFEFFPKVL